MEYISLAFLRKRLGRKIRFDGRTIIEDDSSDEFLSEVSMDGVFISNADGITEVIPVYPPGICYVVWQFQFMK